MAERRSLGEALITPDKLAFIKGSEAKPQTETAKVKEIELTTVSNEEPKATDKQPRSTRKRAREDEAPEATEVLDEMLVSRTARFQYRTAQALTRAHLERKLKRLKPTTQQEIIEIAVQSWLKDHGYLE